jgi:hypothetical protein
MVTCVKPSRAASAKSSAIRFITLRRCAGDDQTIHRFVRSQRGGVVDAAIFGVGLAKAKFFHGLPRPLGKPDQLRKRVTIEHMERIVNADFTGKYLFLIWHNASAIIARETKLKTIYRSQLQVRLARRYHNQREKKS